jgi:hypothetical protein
MERVLRMAGEAETVACPRSGCVEAIRGNRDVHPASEPPSVAV